MEIRRGPEFKVGVLNKVTLPVLASTLPMLPPTISQKKAFDLESAANSICEVTFRFLVIAELDDDPGSRLFGVVIGIHRIHGNVTRPWIEPINFQVVAAGIPHCAIRRGSDLRVDGVIGVELGQVRPRLKPLQSRIEPRDPCLAETRNP